MSNDSQVRKIIELDGESGRFELDEDGYTRFFPSDEEKAAIERWIAAEITTAEEANRERFELQAQNRDAYSFKKMLLDNGGGEAVLPLPTSRIPADQITATMVNNIMRPRPLFAFDPYFADTYPILMPSPQPDPNDAASVAFAQAYTPGKPIKFEIDAETGSRHIEAGVDFKFRERLDFESKAHKVVHHCNIEGYAWLKAFRELKKRCIIKPKTTDLLADLEDFEETEYDDSEQVHVEYVDDSNMLRPNLYQEIDDLDWLSERYPESPDDLRVKYENGEYFLIKDADECERLAKNTTTDIYDPGVRTGKEKGKESDVPRYCDTRDVWPYRWLKVKDERTGKSVRRRFMLLVRYHHGSGKLLAAYRNPYHNQKRIHTVFQQFLDGSSTVANVKKHQNVATHLLSAEVKGRFLANNLQPWHDPTSMNAASHFAKNGNVFNPNYSIPARYGEEWGFASAGNNHPSMLAHIQYLIEGSMGSQATSSQSAYEQGAAAPSHTSPNTVSMLLDRGGQQSILFLRMLNRGFRRVVRLYLEICRQYQPLGETIPVRDKKTRAITQLIHFRYPLGKVLDNFGITLTAADEAMQRERDPDQMAAVLDTHQRHMSFQMQPLAALIDPRTTEAQAGVYRKIIESEQALFDRVIAMTRTDAQTFNLLPDVDAIIAEKIKMIAEAEAAKAMEAQNAAATGDATNGGGFVQDAGQQGDVGTGGGVGAEPGMAGSVSDASTQSVPPTV